MEFVHKSVLLDETMNSLNIRPDGIYVDGTAGGAGHSLQIANKLTTGHLYAFDRDPDAVAVATNRLKGTNSTVINANFTEMGEVLNGMGVEKVDGIIMDLGVSSYQLDNGDRGFSYHKDAPLDMRMSKSGTSAADLVNGLSVEELTRIFRDYGEEKFAFKIAKAIEKARNNAKIETTLQLADIISASVPAKFKRDGHPARKCFQALRIETNGELEGLKAVLDTAFDLLKQDGVMSIITFHSLEDRIVKQKFKEFCTGCTCPPDIPICVCGKTPRGKLNFRKAVLPSEQELSENPRSRSAKLRSIIKL